MKTTSTAAPRWPQDRRNSIRHTITAGVIGVVVGVVLTSALVMGSVFGALATYAWLHPESIAAKQNQSGFGNFDGGQAPVAFYGTPREPSIPTGTLGYSDAVYHFSKNDVWMCYDPEHCQPMERGSK